MLSSSGEIFHYYSQLSTEIGEPQMTNQLQMKIWNIEELRRTIHSLLKLELPPLFRIPTSVEEADTIIDQLVTDIQKLRQAQLQIQQIENQFAVQQQAFQHQGAQQEPPHQQEPQQQEPQQQEPQQQELQQVHQQPGNQNQVLPHQEDNQEYNPQAQTDLEDYNANDDHQVQVINEVPIWEFYIEPGYRSNQSNLMNSSGHSCLCCCGCLSFS